MAGWLLEHLTWVEAEALLNPETIVMIPIGAAAKEHGPHLRLNNDWSIAEFLKHEIIRRIDVVVAPTVNYHHYPAFVDYPGSTSLRLETARDLMVDICRSFARFGPRRFYALNTGVSTVRALEPAAQILADEGVTLRYTNILTVAESVERAIAQQEGGTHADELETSMMLYIAPASVDMRKAVKDYAPEGTGGLSRIPGDGRTFSPTGIRGDPTLATREKGEAVTNAIIEGVLKDLRLLTLNERP